MQGENEVMMNENNGETSKEGLRRMRRLAAEVPCLNSMPRAVIHPTTSQLIYPSPKSSNSPGGYLTSSLSSSGSSSHPKYLPTPSVLNPGNQISLSPNGEWTIIFHPNLNSTTTTNESGEGEGGTLSIYKSGNLGSPLNNSSNIIPISNFQLSSKPLSILHLYPPRKSLPNGRSKELGPNPSNMDEGKPNFLVLLESTILYFYPTSTSGNGNSSNAWAMTYLKSPLNSKSHISSLDQSINVALPPTEDEFKIKKSWLGLIPSNQGIWLGWESVDDFGVTRIEVGLDRFGKIFIQTIPMPTLPRVERIPFPENAQTYKEELQGIIFVSLDNETNKDVKREKTDGMQVDGQNEGDRSPEEIEKVGAVFIFNDIALQSSSSLPTVRTRIQVHSFERRQIELAQGFDDIASGSGDTLSSWDWSTVSQCIHHFTSPTNTTVISLHPLPGIPPNSAALALLSQPAGISLVHMNLLKDEWTIVGEPIELGELKEDVDLDLVVSQGVLRGQLGLAAVTGKATGPTLLVVPRIEGQPILSDLSDGSSLVADAATSIILAERDQADWSDVVRAVIGSIGVGKRKDLITQLNKQVYNLAIEEIDIDELDLLSKVQIALYSSTNDPRLELASDILRLKEAGDLIDRCAIFDSDGKIGFDLDSIWPLIAVMEWSIDLISRSMREVIILGAQIEYSTEPNSDNDLDQPSSTIILINPELRKLVVKILSQLNQFISFITQLDRPILQPESVNNNQTGSSAKRDAMATIVARDRIRDIAYSQGIDISEWGKGLEQVKGMSEEDSNSSLFELCIQSISNETISDVNESLPDSSNLFLSTTQSNLSTKSLYDAITYLPLSNTAISRNTIRCSRCHNVTEELNNLSNSTINNPINGLITSSEKSPWNIWKANFKRRCLCGGIWEKGIQGQGQKR